MAYRVGALVANDERLATWQCSVETGWAIDPSSELEPDAGGALAKEPGRFVRPCPNLADSRSTGCNKKPRRGTGVQRVTNGIASALCDLQFL